MHDRMLKARPGFTLGETMVALVLTAVIGTAVTGVFMSQARFFDVQEKAGFARGVSRGAVNIMMSELRMLEGQNAFDSVSNTQITVRVPYALGVVCNTTAGLTISRFPADPSMVGEAVTGHSGFMWRQNNGTYQLVNSTTNPVAALTSLCTANSIKVISTGNGGAYTLPALVGPGIGSPMLLFQTIKYEFRESTAVPGRVGLYRMVMRSGAEEELVTPFDTTAKFRFYVNDAAAAQTAVPGTLTTITGLELTLDGLSERPEADGTFRSVPLQTSVFFKNRQ